MFFEITAELEDTLRTLLEDYFTEDELKTGLEAFENLINITIPEDNMEQGDADFNQDYGTFLNNNHQMGVTWDLKKGYRLEGFLRKLAIIKDEETQYITLGKFYKRLGFYKRLNRDDVKKARAKDKINADNANNEYGKGGFDLDKADAIPYKDCGQYFYHYIVAYQLRNKLAHDREIKELRKDSSVLIDFIRSMFIVYFDQCIKNYNCINKYYERQLMEDDIDYKSFAERQIKSVKSVEEGFIQLHWNTESDEGFEYDFQSSVKFVGEPGMGKTTQMTMMYYKLLQHVLYGNKKILPIWIDLCKFSDLNYGSLEERIKESLGEYKPHYSILLKNNKIALFLDGYNEIIAEDGKGEDKVKIALAKKLDDIHKKYPEILIAITDRSKRSNPPYLEKNTTVYESKGVERYDIEEYIDKKLKDDPTSAKDIIAYLSSEDSRWMGPGAIIPAKINALIELMHNGITPKDANDFYDKYLDFILEREQTEKKETRIVELVFLLHKLTEKMETADSGKSLTDIWDLWLPLVQGRSEEQKGNLTETGKLFRLAVELKILEAGNDGKYRFAHAQYFYKMKQGDTNIW